MNKKPLSERDNRAKCITLTQEQGLVYAEAYVFKRSGDAP